MSLTFAQVSDKVSELRSKIAIQEMLVLHLSANYKSSDSGEAEMHVHRSDYATVPEAHIDKYIDQAVEQLEQMNLELQQWETLPVPTPNDKPEPDKKKKRTSCGTTRRRNNPSAPGNGKPGKA